MPFYASPEQLMRDKSEYARKNIARGRNIVVMSYADGVLFVAENLSTALHKVGEIYDRIAFGAVGRYNEFESLRMAGVRLADVRGYSYHRSDVTGRWLANTYAQTLGALFTEQAKPLEVEICIAQVGSTPEQDELYRLTYDGSVSDEPGFIAMGGQADALSRGLKREHQANMSLSQALGLATEALGSVGGDGSQPRRLAASQLEVAVLDRRRTGRTFRRITGVALDTALAEAAKKPAKASGGEEPAPAAGAVKRRPSTTKPAAGEKSPDTPSAAAPEPDSDDAAPKDSSTGENDTSQDGKDTSD